MFFISYKSYIIHNITFYFIIKLKNGLFSYEYYKLKYIKLLLVVFKVELHNVLFTRKCTIDREKF